MEPKDAARPDEELALLRRAFGAVLRRKRQERRFRLLDVAERAGITAAYVLMLERGENQPTLYVMDRLAATFGQRLSELAREVEDMRRHLSTAAAIPDDRADGDASG